MKLEQENATSASDREITITRVVNAPRELVFRCWTDPAHIGQWWGPKGYSTVFCEIDLRIGGEFRLDMRGPNGVVYPCRGVFQQIVSPRKIVYAGSPDAEPGCGAGLPRGSIVTVTFVENLGKTTITLHTLLQSPADREAAVKQGFDVGWGSSIERLEEMLVAEKHG